MAGSHNDIYSVVSGFDSLAEIYRLDGTDLQTYGALPILMRRFGLTSQMRRAAASDSGKYRGGAREALNWENIFNSLVLRGDLWRNWKLF